MFPRIFGSEENVDLLTSLMSSVLKIPEESFKDIEVVHNDGVNAVCVVEASVNGVRTCIGIYIVPWAGMANRVMLEWGKNFLLSFISGRGFFGMKRAIPIIICEEDFVPGEKCHHKLHLTDKENKRDFSDVYEIHLLEMQKALNSVKDEESEIADPLLNWLRFLSNNDEDVCATLSQQSATMRKAVDLQKRYSAENAHVVNE